MNSDKIVVVDFGIGNLFSVESALKKCGVQSVSISSDAIDIANADRLILPGVGSFRNGVKSLKRHGLNAAIKSHSIEGKPLLGICLGMQLLATTGTEYGESEGLDIIPGRVLHILHEEFDDFDEKVPFIGWSPLIPNNKFDNSILRNVSETSSVYHLHSFHFVPKNSESLLASYNFGTQKITAAVRSGNTYGLQFHPEKSGELGLDILTEFTRL